jgi:hypothetical protein
MKFNEKYLTWFNPGKERLIRRQLQASIGSDTYVRRLAKEAKRRQKKKNTDARRLRFIRRDFV